jgi:predicted DNA binding protein
MQNAELPADMPPPFEGLTHKQWRALRAATDMGFFERPQQATAAEVAESLDVTRTTFLYHLRNAENHVFTAVCERE